MELFKIEDKPALAALVAAYEHAEKTVALVDALNMDGIDGDMLSGKLDDAAEILYGMLMSICAKHPCADWAAGINGLGPSWAINMLLLYNADIIKAETDLLQLCLLDGYAKPFSRGSALAMVSQLSVNDKIPLPAIEQVCRQTCRSIGLLRHTFKGYSHLSLEQACDFLRENPCFLPMKDLTWAAMNSPDFITGDDEIAVAYRESLETQEKLNDAGDFRDLCRTKLTQCSKMTQAEAALCDSGILPPRLIRSRARRFAMRMALGKFHRLLMDELNRRTSSDNVEEV